MPNALPHKEEQAVEAQRLADEGRTVGLRCLATATLYLAQKAVASVTGSTSDVFLREAVRDLQAVRNEPEFLRALDADLSASTDAVEQLLVEAMSDGLEREMAFLVTQFKGMSFEMTDLERIQMHGYPIQGHTVAEISKYMHSGLRYEIDGALASPLVGDSSVKSVPQFLGAIVQRFSDRVSGAVQEAYYAGVQLASRMAAQAVADAG